MTVYGRKSASITFFARSIQRSNFSLLKFGLHPYRILMAFLFLLKFADLRILAVKDKIVYLSLRKNRLFLPLKYFWILFREWEDLDQHYFPVDLRGKRILDIGAGAGETALRYLAKGAREIVCIEPDSEAFLCLRRNNDINNWRCQTLNEFFKPEHLNLDYDFFKIDIEGSEKVLLEKKISLKGSGVIEYHGREIGEGLKELYGMRLISCKGDGSLGYAYFNC